MKETAILVLEDGTCFTGVPFGAKGERYGEIVFNTGLTGYQEVLSDPSYQGQIVTMTYPLIGNYGVNENDMESRALWLEGFVVKEACREPSNWRSTNDINSFLMDHNIVGIEGVDTRALTRHIRESGAMRAVISTEDLDLSSLVEKVRLSPDLIGRDLVREVTCDQPYTAHSSTGLRVVVLDFGVKTSIIRQLCHAGCAVTVMPASSSVDEIRWFDPDGVLLSNGPGDPAAVTYAVDTIRALIALGTMPLFGICLGHQLLGLALGGDTFKLKFGHHGGNHPVKDIKTGKIDITVQNHGFCVNIDSLAKDSIEVTHTNLNDGTLEGMRHATLPLFSVQFHPEAGPGPHDGRYLFGRFIEVMKKYSRRG
jgi:carbamoyl-phosphate synthase small subunit